MQSNFYPNCNVLAVFRMLIMEFLSTYPLMKILVSYLLNVHFFRIGPDIRQCWIIRLDIRLSGKKKTDIRQFPARNAVYPAKIKLIRPNPNLFYETQRVCVCCFFTALDIIFLLGVFITSPKFV